eukprot:966204-Rhodomonas_salina.2
MQCPVLTYGMPRRCPVLTQQMPRPGFNCGHDHDEGWEGEGEVTSRMLLRACYAMSGTDPECSGTQAAYARARSCPVLTWRFWGCQVKKMAGEKRNVRDFALWKPVIATDEAGWDSEFGFGRPG